MSFTDLLNTPPTKCKSPSILEGMTASSDLSTLYTAAITAIDAGDYDTAIVKAAAIQLRLSIAPDLGGTGDQSIAWKSADQAQAFIDQCRKLKAASLSATYGMQQIQVEYERPGQTGDYA